MRESQPQAGQDPADLAGSAAGKDFTGGHVVPAATRLHSALAACDAMISQLAERARDEHYSFSAQTEFVLAAAKLAAAQAQTSTAIARLADAESRQRLTTMKVDDAALGPRRHQRATPDNRPRSGSASSDWEIAKFEEEKSTFNSAFAGPRMRQP